MTLKNNKSTNSNRCASCNLINLIRTLSALLTLLTLFKLLTLCKISKKHPKVLTAIREGTRKRIANEIKKDLIAKDSPTDLLV